MIQFKLLIITKLRYLGDSALHDQEVRIVDIQLNRPEEVFHAVLLDVGAVDEVLVLASDDHLSGDGHLIVGLVSQWRLLLVSVVEGDGDRGLGDPRLTVLVDQLLQVGGSHVAEVGDAQQEADGVQDVTFTRSDDKNILIKNKS